MAMKVGMTRADSVVLIFAFVLLPYLYFTFWGNTTAGQQARILVGGKEFAVVSLLENRRLEIPGSLGVSKLEVRAGKIRFLDSPCRNKQCVHSGWLAVSNDIAVCLPNRISVQIIGRDARFDAINF